MRDHAIALIAKSAEQAGGQVEALPPRLWLDGFGGDQVSLGETRDALEGFLKDSKTKARLARPAMLIGKRHGEAGGQSGLRRARHDSGAAAS